MSLTSNDIKDIVLGLYKQKSDRDKQKKVGASNISNPCTRHLAWDLMRGVVEEEEKVDKKYWMGAVNGTFIHAGLESRIATSSDIRLNGALVERKIKLGDVPGYGLVSSKPDLFLPDYNVLVDHKTSTRPKMKKLKNLVDGIKDDAESMFTLQKYMGQTNLYARGLEDDGFIVEDLFLNFINRDGTNDDDIWVYDFKYDRSIADALWNRLIAVWTELQNGAHPNDYAATKHCYQCSIEN